MKHPNVLSPDISQIISKAFSPHDWLVEKTHSYHATSSLVAFDGTTQAIIPIDMFEMVLARLEADKKIEKDKQDAQDTEEIKAQETTEENVKPQAEDENSEKQKDDVSSYSDVQSAETQSNNSNTEAHTEISQSQFNRYSTPLPNPLSIRDGWDEDYVNISIGNNTFVFSQARNLDISDHSFYAENFYTEVLPSTVTLATEEGCGCSCNCDLSGQWILEVRHDPGQWGEEINIAGIINSITLNFSNGQTFSSATSLNWDEPNQPPYLYIPYYLDTMSILVENVCSDLPLSMTVTLDLVVPDGDGLVLTLSSPNGSSIVLLSGFNSDGSNSSFELGYNGVYELDDSNLNLPNLSLDQNLDNDSGTPDGDVDPGIYNTYESDSYNLSDFINDACDTDSSSGGITPPIVFDLDGDGLFNLLSHEEANVLFDVDNDGVKEQTAWVGPNDGILVFDLFNDKQITNANEFSFANWHPDAKSDLEGLQLVFDSNKDNILDAQDIAWKQMGIWQDKNQNGVTDEGEYSSLDDLGIISISLTSDGHLQMINGNTILGTISAQKANGESLAAADVLLSYAEVPQNSDSKMPIAEWSPPPPVLQEVTETVEL